MEWEHLIKSLLSNNGNNKHVHWTDGEEILCKTEKQAEVFADFFEDIGFDYVNTGYYNPIEDERNNKVDDHTGYWYVSVD